MSVSFGIRIPPCEAIREVARAARVAETGGFSHVWTLDSPFLAGRLMDPYLTLGACAGTTSRVRLGVAVTNAISRHPLATACAAHLRCITSRLHFELLHAVGRRT